MADIRIVMTGHGRGEVFVGGVKVEKVRKIEFSSEPACTNEVRVTIIPETVEIEGPAEVSRLPPPPPLPPPSRVDYRAWPLIFIGPEDEFEKWKAEPYWRRMFGLTTWDKVRRSRNG